MSDDTVEVERVEFDALLKGYVALRDRDPRGIWGNPPNLTRLVSGVLRSVLNDHGPITTVNYHSAAKRIANQLWATMHQQRAAAGANPKEGT